MRMHILRHTYTHKTSLPLLHKTVKQARLTLLWQCRRSTRTVLSLDPVANRVPSHRRTRAQVRDQFSHQCDDLVGIMVHDLYFKTFVLLACRGA